MSGSHPQGGVKMDVVLRDVAKYLDSRALARFARTSTTVRRAVLGIQSPNPARRPEEEAVEKILDDLERRLDILTHAFRRNFAKAKRFEDTLRDVTKENCEEVEEVSQETLTSMLGYIQATLKMDASLRRLSRGNATPDPLKKRALVMINRKLKPFYRAVSVDYDMWAEIQEEAHAIAASKTKKKLR